MNRLFRFSLLASAAIAFCSLVSVSFLACATSPKVVQPAVPQLTEGQRLKKSQELADTARQQVDQGRNAEALDLANEALKLDPENGVALIQQGKAYRNLNKGAKALASFEQAVKYLGETNEVLINIGMYYRDYESVAKAQEVFAKVIKASPNDGWANRELGNLFSWKLQDYDKALACFTIAIANGNNDPWIYNDVSIVYEKQGNMAKAREYLLLAKARIDSGQGDDWIKRQVTERLATLK
jgi:tetratricopeptide (TPR) repeat protein